MILFSLFSSIALISAGLVIRAKNPVHSVLFLILVFCNAAGLQLLLGLDFIAMILLVVYVGAIAVLFLFVVMMLNIKIAEIHENVLRYLPVGGIIGLIFLLEMFFHTLSAVPSGIVDNSAPYISNNESSSDNLTSVLTSGQVSTSTLNYTHNPTPDGRVLSVVPIVMYATKIQSWTNIESIGNLLYTHYLLFFLLCSLILLVAMIGAIVLTMHKTTLVKRQDVFLQNSVDFQTTIHKIRG